MLQEDFSLICLVFRYCNKYFSFLKYKKENMDILTAEYQCEMEGSCRRSEAWQFFLLLKICYTQFLLCLSP